MRILFKIATIGILIALGFINIHPASAPVGNWTIDGDKVYVDDSKAYISASPHTLQNSGWVVFNISSKNYSGNVDIAFGFNISNAKPKKAELYSPQTIRLADITTDKTFYNITSISATNEFPEYGNTYNLYRYRINYSVPVGYVNATNTTIWGNAATIVAFDSCTKDGSNCLPFEAYKNYTLTWNTTRYQNTTWQNVAEQFDSLTWEYDGFNKWYFATNLPVVAGEYYNLRVWIDIPMMLGTNNGKYGFAIKPSSQTLQEAKDSGNLYYLDPWWDVTKLSAIHMDLPDYSRYSIYTFNLTNTSGTNNKSWIYGNGLLNRNNTGWNFTINNATEIPATCIYNNVSGVSNCYVNVTQNVTSLDFYYNEGNLGQQAGDASNVNATFAFGSLFDNLNVWTQVSGTWTVANGYLHTPTGGSGNTNLRSTNEVGIEDEYVVETRMKGDSTAYAAAAFVTHETTPAYVQTAYSIWAVDSANWFYSRADNVDNGGTGLAVVDATWYKYKNIISKTATHFSYMYDDSDNLLATNSGTSDTAQTGTYATITSSRDNGDNFYTDYYLIYKYNPDVPLENWGAAESQSSTTYTPPAPTNCQATTGNFYVNMSCEAGSGNVTDGMNKSINGVWYNDTAFFKNITLSAHAWGNGSYQAWNNSGILNSTPAALNTQIPNNAISVSGVSSSYSLNEGQTLTIDADYTDADSDVAIFTTNATKGSINSGTGVYTLNSIDRDQGTYYWNISATDNNGSTSIANLTVTINYALLPTVEPSGVYAFLNNSIPSNATILNYKNNEILTTVITLDWDNISSSNWTSLLQGINYSYTNGIRVAIRLNLGGDYTSTAIQNNAKSNITDYFPDLTSDPYQSDVQYVELNFTNTTSPSADKRAFANLTAKNISEQSGNKFTVYTVEIISSLDADYVKSSPLIYLNIDNNSDFVSKESVTTRGNTTTSRVYSGNETTLSLIASYKTNIFNRLRGTISASHPSESYATYVNNGSSGYDIILYNNQSTIQNRTVANQFGTFLDSTNDLMRKLSSSGTLYFNVSAENVSYILNESVNKIILNDTTHTVYGSITSYNQTFAHGTSYSDAYIYAGSNTDIKTELYDPTYTKKNVTYMIHYEWINSSLVSNYSDYKYVIVSDQNAGEINSTINRTNESDLMSRPFIYFSVGDYVDNGGAWKAAKKAETQWAWSRGYQAFIDGIDIAVETGGNFSADVKDVINDFRVNHSGKVICNTYTAYEQFATGCDVVMKESAFSRWDGSVSSPTYSWEDMDLEKQRADYYTSHNIPVLLQSYGDANDYERLYFDYLGGAVLYGYNGNNSFRYGQPNFQNQRDIYVPDLGDMLERGYTETSSTDWNRLYSKGRVHINPVAHTASIDNNKVVNNISLEIYLYSGGAGSGNRNVTVAVHNPNGTLYNITYGSPNIAQWYWEKVELPISEYKEHGQYRVYFATRPTAGGWNVLGIDGTAKTGIHSWYDTTGANMPNEGNDSNYTWTARPRDTQWMVKLNVDYNTTLQIDTLASSTISQADSRTSGNRTITISSSNEYNTSIFSKAVQLTTNAINSIWFKAINGSWISANMPTTNVSDINATNPTWTETVIDGYVYGVIKQYISTNSWWVKFLFPHLSQQEAMVGENVAPSTPVLTEHDDFHTLGSTTVNWTASTDENGDALTYDVKVYNTSTGVLVVNQTNISTNYSQNFLPANWTNYNFTVRSYDLLDYSDWAGIQVFNFTNAVPSISNTTNQTVDENTTIFVDIDGSDTDGDGLIFSTNRTDLFTDFSTSTGKGNWTTNFSSSGTHSVDFGVSDGYNDTNYTVILTITDVPLSITAFQPSSNPSIAQNIAQAFNITLNRSANVTWQLDGVSVQTNTSIKIVNYTNSGTTAGTFNITVSATDGVDNVSRQWNITVTAPAETTTSSRGASISPVGATETKTEEAWTDGRKDYPFAVAFEGKDGQVEPLNSDIHGILALNMLFKTPAAGTYTITISTYTDYKPRLNGSLKYFSITPNFGMKSGSSIEVVLEGINKDVELYQLYSDGKWKKVSKGTKLSKLSKDKDKYRFPITSFGTFAVKQVAGQEVTANLVQPKATEGWFDFDLSFKNIQQKDREIYEMLKVKLEWLVDVVERLKALVNYYISIIYP